jgi:hypothetical protein
LIFNNLVPLFFKYGAVQGSFVSGLLVDFFEYDLQADRCPVLQKKEE